jgi:hypothetical protein
LLTREVVVRLGPQAFVRTALSGIPAGSRQARTIARRLLAEHLWREGLLPPDEGLSVEEVSAAQIAALGDEGAQ